MLRMQALEKTFFPGTSDEVHALRGVSLDIPRGEWVVVLGGNGSGKSTLQNAIAGTFIADRGSIWVDGTDITNWPEHRRARLVGRVFQNPFSGTAPTMSIAENFALAAGRGRRRGFAPALARKFLPELRERVGQLRMGLHDRLDSPIGTLSGGQRQALTLLMATWREPSVLLLDEHTAALDPKSAEKVSALTADIVGRQRLTTLMVTHSMQQAVALGDRIIMMHRGQVLHDVRGPAKRRLRIEDLLARFEDARRRDLLDESAADLLAATYV